MRSFRSLLWNILSKIFSFLIAAPTAFMNMRGLRYYATFEGRKFESLFYKINTCLQKTTTCRQANILSKFVIDIFCFCVSFAMLFPKAPTSCCKKILNQILLHCTSIFMSSKNMSQIFKILFQTEDINIFVLRDVLFSRYVQLKIFFSDETNSGEIWDIL